MKDEMIGSNRQVTADNLTDDASNYSNNNNNKDKTDKGTGGKK